METEKAAEKREEKRREDERQEAEWAVECMGHMEEWRVRLENVVREGREVELRAIGETRRRLERMRE